MACVPCTDIRTEMLSYISDIIAYRTSDVACSMLYRCKTPLTTLNREKCRRTSARLVVIHVFCDFVARYVLGLISDVEKSRVITTRSTHKITVHAFHNNFVYYTSGCRSSTVYPWTANTDKKLKVNKLNVSPYEREYFRNSFTLQTIQIIWKNSSNKSCS